MHSILWHFQRVRIFRLTDVPKLNSQINCLCADPFKRRHCTFRSGYFHKKSNVKFGELTLGKPRLLHPIFRDIKVLCRPLHVSQPCRAPNPLFLWVFPKVLTITVAILGHRILLAKRYSGPHSEVIQQKLMRISGIIFLSLALSILIFYVAHIDRAPITNRRRFIAFSNQDMMEMTAFETQLIDMEFGKFYLNSSDPTFRRVQRVVSRILQSNQDIQQIRERQWNLIVINIPEVKNAFILPNGNMYVFTGILNICRNDDEVGFVVAHELSHAVLEHLAEQMSHIYLGEFLFLLPAFLIWSFLPTLAALVTHFLARHCADALFNLPFSRYSEIEADMIGIQLASKACFDPRQAMIFWRKMILSSDEGIPWRYKIEWLSTHPSYETRARYLEKILPTALAIRKQNNCPTLTKLEGSLNHDFDIKSES